MDEREANRLFEELQFYNALIEKPEIKDINNKNLLRELPFYDELIILKTSKTSSGYARNYSIEIIDSKCPLVQLIISKPSIEYLFEYLLNQMKGFEYQITPKVLLSKYKEKNNR